MRITSSEYVALLSRRRPQFVAAGAGLPSCAAKLEADIQEQIESHLKAFGHRCYYFRARMDIPTTGRVGTPDFIGWLDAKPFALEVKRPGAKETREQAGELMRCQLAGAKVAIVHSLEEAVEALIGL